MSSETQFSTIKDTNRISYGDTNDPPQTTE